MQLCILVILRQGGLVYFLLWMFLLEFHHKIHHVIMLDIFEQKQKVRRNICENKSYYQGGGRGRGSVMLQTLSWRYCHVTCEGMYWNSRGGVAKLLSSWHFLFMFDNNERLKDNLSFASLAGGQLKPLELCVSAPPSSTVSDRQKLGAKLQSAVRVHPPTHRPT